MATTKSPFVARGEIAHLLGIHPEHVSYLLDSRADILEPAFTIGGGGTRVYHRSDLEKIKRAYESRRYRKPNGRGNVLVASDS